MFGTGAEDQGGVSRGVEETLPEVGGSSFLHRCRSVRVEVVYIYSISTYIPRPYASMPCTLTRTVLRFPSFGSVLSRLDPDAKHDIWYLKFLRANMG